MRHLHVRIRVPAPRVDALLDEVYRLAREAGTLSIVNLIDEAREDIYLEVVHTGSESHHGRTKDPRPKDRDRDRWRAQGGTA